jgi:hypothetical protein
MRGPPKTQRAQGMPGEGLTHGPRAVKKHGEGTTGSAKIIRHSLRNGLRLIRDLPGNRAFLLPSHASFVTLRAWPQRREARTTRFRRPHRRRSSARSLARVAKTSIASRAPRIVTIGRNAPLQARRDGRMMPLIWGRRQVVFRKSERSGCDRMARRAICAWRSCADCPFGRRDS